jgi:hypothetical protein
MDDYAFVNVNPEWPTLVVAINELEIRLRRQRRPVAADKLLRAYGKFRDELLLLGREVAAFGTAELRRQEKQTRVRPDDGRTGQPRLNDFLVAEVIDANLLPGSVGIANENLLEREVPWWITNEVGSSARVGGVLYGTFYGENDAGPPDPSMFREHPLFEPGPNGSLSGMGVIQNPIPARQFVEKAVLATNRRWQEGFSAAKIRFDTELTRVLNTYE